MAHSRRTSSKRLRPTLVRNAATEAAGLITMEEASAEYDIPVRTIMDWMSNLKVPGIWGFMLRDDLLASPAFIAYQARDLSRSRFSSRAYSQANRRLREAIGLAKRRTV